MGKLKRGREAGFALIDAILALLVAGVAMVILLGYIGVGARFTADMQKRALDLIDRRNRYEEEREIVYSSE